MKSCGCIATPANALVAPFHDRMPAILSPTDYATWFDTEAPLTDVHAMLKPYPAELMAVSEANVLVNSPKNEGTQLLVPVA